MIRYINIVIGIFGLYNCAIGQSEFECNSFIIEDKYRFVEAVTIEPNLDSNLFITMVFNLYSNELDAIQFSILDKYQLTDDAFVWVKLQNGLYLDLRIIGLAKRKIKNQELPTALVKPYTESIQMLLTEPVELVKIRRNDLESSDTYYEVYDPYIFQKMLKCVAYGY